MFILPSLIATVAKASVFFVSGGSTSVSGRVDRLGAGTETVTTSSATVGTITGGTSPYSYLWQYVSGDTFSIGSSTSSSTTFSKSLTVDLGETAEAIGYYQCRVTDGASRVTYGPVCQVTATLVETS